MPLLGSRGAASLNGFGGLANLGYFTKNSLRFRGGSAGLNAVGATSFSRTVASGSASTKGTFSVWAKRGQSYDSSNNGALVAAADSYYYGQFFNEGLYFGNTTSYMNTAAVYRDYAAWYHIVFIFDTTLATSTDRLQIWVNGVRQTAGATVSYPTQNASFPFLNSAQAWHIGGRPESVDGWYDGHLAECYFIDGQALTPSSFAKTDATTGQWIPKKYSGTYGTNGFYLNFSNTSDVTATTLGKDYSGNGNNWTPNNFTVATTEPYPVSTVGSDSGTVYDKQYMFDGSLYSAATIPQSNDNYLLFTPTTPINYTSSVRVYVYAANGYNITNYYSVNGGGETSFTGGSAGFNGKAWITVASGSGTLSSLKVRLTRSGSPSFVQWAAIEVDGVILTNKFFNGCMTDSPSLSGGGSNYATFNPLITASGASYINGNLTANLTNGSNQVSGSSTIFVNSGKWYAEFILSNNTGSYPEVGIISAAQASSSAGNYLGATSQSYSYYAGGGIQTNGGVTTTTGYATYDNGHVIGVALDMDNGNVWWSKNGTWQGASSPDPATGTSPAYSGLTANGYMGFGVGGPNFTTWNANFGQRPFAYTPPTGFKALNTYNLP
jgi:hypothetical protein